MKRTATFAILFLALVFTACKKDSSPSVSIVGNWKIVTLQSLSVDSTTTPITKVESDTTYAPATALVATFNTDNSYYTVDFSNTPPTVAQSGSYILNNGKITIIPTGQSNQVANYTLTSTTLTLVLSSSTAGHYSAVTEILTRQ